MQPRGLIGRLYRFWHPHVDQAELDFYRNEIKNCQGPALELACGSGRLLLPFVKEGLDVEGVEGSSEMVTLLRRKAEKGGVELPEVYCQKLHELTLKKTYHLIYCPLGSFQLLSDLSDVETTLEKCYRYLDDKGELVIALFLPWDEAPTAHGGWSVVSNRRLAAKNMRQVFREKVNHDPIDQLITLTVRDEIWLKKQLLEAKERTFFVRWYSKGEFVQMLKSAGFTSIEVERRYSPDEAPRESFMLFRARKEKQG